MSRPQIMVLGSYHMANPGKDYANLRADDVLAPARQAEIQSVVTSLAAFGPTKIAVETSADRQHEIDEAYDAFRRGDQNHGEDESGVVIDRSLHVAPRRSAQDYGRSALHRKPQQVWSTWGTGP